MSSNAAVEVSSYINGQLAENEQNRKDALEERAVLAFAAAYDAAGEWLDKYGVIGSEAQVEASSEWFAVRFHNTLENLSPEQYRIFCAHFGPVVPSDSPYLA